MTTSPDGHDGGLHRPEERDPLREALKDFFWLAAVVGTFFTIYSVVGLTYAVVVAILLLGAVAIRRINIIRPFRAQRLFRATAWTLVIASAAWLVVGLVSTHHGRSSVDTGSSPSQLKMTTPSTSRGGSITPPLQTSSSSPVSPPQPTQTATGIAIPSPDTCGPSAEQHPLPPIQICVVFWCRGSVFNLDGEEVRSQAQIKVRPRITNNGPSATSVDISRPSAIRLIVSGSDLPRAWKPPPGTVSNGDRPTVISYRGEHYWGIPPDVPHDAQLLRDGSGYTGFATEWSVTRVLAGSSYFVPLTHHSDGSPVQAGDLVFQIPQDERIVGLAVVTRSANPSVLGFEAGQSWPASSDPASF